MTQQNDLLLVLKKIDKKLAPAPWHIFLWENQTVIEDAKRRSLGGFIKKYAGKNAEPIVQLRNLLPEIIDRLENRS